MLSDDQLGNASVIARLLLVEANETHGPSFELDRRLAGGWQSGAYLLVTGLSDAGVARGRREPRRLWLRGPGAGDRRHPRAVDGRSGTSLIGVLELQAGLDPDPERSWSVYLTDWYATQWATTVATVAAMGPGGRSLVEAGNALLAGFDAPSFSTQDLVHGDFRLGNVLFDGDRVSGVVDIEALGSGDGALDYATLLDHADADEDAVQLLVAAGVEAAGPAALAHSLVHVFLDLAMFMMRHIVDIDPAHPDQRARTLAARAALVDLILSRAGHSRWVPW